MIQFDEHICRDLAAGSEREWLETNGLGGYASSTLCGMNTRRYHGLLVAATQPPAGRLVLLSKVEETLVIDGVRYDLSVNQYPGAVHPNGNDYLKQFRLDPFPTFVYRVAGVQLQKTIFMVHGENTTVIQYELLGQAQSCVLELRPLLAFRDYHSTTHENQSLNPTLDIEPGSVQLTPYRDLPTLHLAHTVGEVQPAGFWYRNFEFDRERERGLDYLEDLFNPCAIVVPLSPGTPASLIASTAAHDVETAGRLRDSEVARRLQVLQSISTERPFVQTLARAADQFVVARGEHASVIAGYHWFCDWGRDTMIALPGLTLSTGRPEMARGILLSFAASVNQGMLPNRFPDFGETPEYNTVDATLWFFEAVRAYLAATNDIETIRVPLYDVLTDIVAWHERGTRFGIHMDTDGLLSAGEPGTQLTWMDAKVGDWVVTPRHGKPVEIQALWYNALRIIEDLATTLGRPADAGHYRGLADRAAASFVPMFWNASAGCLYDVVDGDRRDASIRPNQIFAVSLFHKMLPPEQAASVVQTVERDLLTPFGLRTLSPSDPQYRGRFEGDPRSRDSAYHQGTVWPWLLGPFIKAYLEVNARSPKARKQAAKWLADLNEYILDTGVGQLPEVFDGDAPHRAGGCIAQAWSVAEVLRTCVEDIFRTPSPQAAVTKAGARAALV